MTPSYFSTEAQVQKLRRELQSWLGTPFSLNAAVKGEGVDCVRFVAESMMAVRVITEYTFPRYSLDYSHHHTHSLVLGWLEECSRVAKLQADEQQQAGDVACFRYGKTVHHCGVMFDDLRMVHALEGRSVVWGQLNDSTWAKRLVCFYRPLPL